MKLIWTKSGLPLSKLIRWGLNESCSHFAIVFDDKLVFHSNLSGVNIQGIYNFQAHCEIVHEIELNLTLKQEEAIYLALLQKYEGKGYDFKAFFYFIYRAVRFKFLGEPLPSSNPWNTEGYLCIGLAEAIKQTPDAPEWLRNAIPETIDLEMLTPEKLYIKIKSAQNPS